MSEARKSKAIATTIISGLKGRAARFRMLLRVAERDDWVLLSEK